MVANLVIEDIECRALSSFHIPPCFWRRYCMWMTHALFSSGTYQSHHPTARMKAVVRTLMCRAETLSSTGVSRRVQKEEHVQQSLQKNGYPVASSRGSLPQPVPRNEEQTALISGYPLHPMACYNESTECWAPSIGH